VRWPQYSSDNIPARMRAFEKPCFEKKVAWLNSQWGTDSKTSGFNTIDGVRR